MKIIKLIQIAFLAVLLTACVTESRLAPSGAYAATASVAAQPELYMLDSSFDLAYSGLDTAFKYEYDNRQLLWHLDKRIKQSMDKIRVEAGKVKYDYALAREEYLRQPTKAGLDKISEALAKLQSLNSAVLVLVNPKGK